MRRYLLPLVALPLLAACGDDGDTGPGDAAADVAADVADAATDAAADAATDAAPEDVAVDTAPELDFTPDPSCTEGDLVVRLNGTITDSDGTALEGVKAQVCLRRAASDLVLCLRPVDSGADGTFSVVLPERERCVEQLSLRVLRPASTFATTYCHIDTTDAAADLVVAAPFALFDTQPPADLPPLADGDTARDVDLGNGVVVSVIPTQLDAEIPFEDAYLELRSVRLDPATTTACFIDPEYGFDSVVGFDPELDVRDGAFDVVLPNVAGHAPGTAIDVYVQGGLFVHLAAGTLVPEADWVRSGSGTVSEDGASIVADGALAGFNWLAWKAAE